MVMQPTSKTEMNRILESIVFRVRACALCEKKARGVLYSVRDSLSW